MKRRNYQRNCLMLAIVYDWACLLIAYMTQADWTPDVEESLFREIQQPETDLLYPEFVQPTSTSYYNKGDRMAYTDGYYYELLIDVNTYSPDEYPQGWKEIGAI